MARKIKPGKFKYDLETVLRVRQIREKKEQEKFAEKRRIYLEEKEKEKKLKDQKKREEEELRASIREGIIKDFQKIMSAHAHIDIVKEEIEKQEKKVMEASRKLEDQRGKLVKAVKDKKIMEKDKEKTIEKYKKLMLDLELKFLDEIATQRFQRQQRGEA